MHSNKLAKIFRLALRNLIATLILCTGALTHVNAQISSRGTEFWVGYMENLDLAFNGPPKFYFYIFADQTTEGVLSVPATGYTQTFTVVGGQSTKLSLPQGIFYGEGSETVDQKGILVTTQKPVTMAVHHDRLYFSEASAVLPASLLDSRYTVITHKHDVQGGGLAEFVVVATEDNTIIEITPKVITRDLRPAGLTFTVGLKRGETYQVQSYSELTGTTVKAKEGKKIAVFSGSLFTEILCASTSHLYDQSYPNSLLRSNYILLPFRNQYLGDKFRIMAVEDNTKIYFECIANKNLNKGEFFDTLLSVPLHLKADRPVAVGQFKPGQNCSELGDCTFLMNSPLGFNSKKSMFNSLVNGRPGGEFSEHDLLVTTRTEHINSLFLDNVPVQGFTMVPNNPDYSCIRLNTGQGDHSLASVNGFWAMTAGFGFADGYSYSLGYDEEVNNINSLVANFSPTICLAEELQMSFTAPAGFGSWTIRFGDGQSINENTAKHKYAEAGKYVITVNAIDSKGCLHAADALVQIIACKEEEKEKEKACEVFVPTAFSPDGSEVNSKACVYSACMKEMDFKIFSRWGEMLFRSEKVLECWDGTYKGQKVNMGVYGWSLTGKTNDGREVDMKGHITLVK